MLIKSVQKGFYMVPVFECVTHSFRSREFNLGNPLEEGVALIDLTDHVFAKGEESANTFHENIREIANGKEFKEPVRGCITVIDLNI